jgi:3-oxoadipate enol-lactonase
METTVAVGADKVWAEDSGGPGPVLVLLHPGVGDGRIWDRMWPGLTGTCRVIRYEVRGYGRSPAATEEYTLAGDLRRVLDHFGIDQAHLVGCSMGGIAAVDLAVADPGRVRSLTLLCPAISGYPFPEESPELIAEWEKIVGDEDAMVAFYQRMWAAAGADPEVLEQLRSAIRAEPNEEQFQRPAASPAWDRLAGLRVPAVLMVGDRDRPALIACDEEAARRIPGCQLIRMPGVDHLPPLREPELITATILASVRSAEGTAAAGTAG